MVDPDGKAAKKVDVYLVGETNQSKKTDAGGYFSFKRLRPGSYQVTARDLKVPGATSYDVDVPGGESVDVGELVLENR